MIFCVSFRIIVKTSEVMSMIYGDDYMIPQKKHSHVVLEKIII